MEQIILFSTAADHDDPDRPELSERRLNGIGGVIDVLDLACPVSARPCWWQHDKLPLLEFTQHGTAGHILEQSGVVTPVP